MRLKGTIVKLGLLLLIVFTIIGCGGGGGGGGGDDDGDGDDPGETDKWNFLVYLDGDNNLEEAAIKDINEMEMVGSTDDVNIYVLVDRINGYDSSNGNWTDTRLYKIKKDSDTSVINSELIQNYGELDMSDPNTLRDFIEKCNTLAPNRNTVLTFWNHGGGVLPKSAGGVKKDLNSLMNQSSTEKNNSITKGICWDDTSGTTLWHCLTTDEAAAALSAARNTTGKKINVINMDACLMQMLEIAYELRNEADYLVGSQEVVPGDGNDYTALLNRLVDDPSMSSETLAKHMVDDYYNFYNALGMSTTYSAFRLGAEFTALMNAFKPFATALNNTADLASASKAWLKTTYFEYYEQNDLYDFANEIGALTSDETVKSAAQAVKAAIGNMVLHHRETGIYQGRAYGLSILLTKGAEWGGYDGSNQYASLSFAKNTDWDEFLPKFASATNSLTTGNGETLKYEISWGSGDLDVLVIDADDDEYYYTTASGTSPNGVFSANQTNGGTESWTLYNNHTIGLYAGGVRNRTGNTILVTFRRIKNGITTSSTGSIGPNGAVVVVEDHSRSGKGGQLKFVEIPILKESQK